MKNLNGHCFDFKFSESEKTTCTLFDAPLTIFHSGISLRKQTPNVLSKVGLLSLIINACFASAKPLNRYNDYICLICQI